MFPKTLLLAFGATAYAAVHDSVNGIPHGWQASPHSVPENAAMKLFVSLQYQNLGQLQSQLEAVSTPGSPLYGQYQDVNEQAAMFAPASDAVSKVMAWLKQHNAANIQRTGNMVSFTSSVGQVNKMLNTTFQMYTDGQKSRLRTTEYSIPSDLTSFVDTISPTTYFGDMKPESPMPSMPELDLEVEKRQVDPSCQTPYVSPSTGNKFLLFTPECAKELYNTKGYKADPRSGSNIAFASFLGQSPNYADLRSSRITSTSRRKTSPSLRLSMAASTTKTRLQQQMVKPILMSNTSLACLMDCPCTLTSPEVRLALRTAAYGVPTKLH